MPRPFLMWPDPRLRAAAAEVPEIDAAIHAIWDEMLEAMYGMPGVGLAAPQLGIGLRLAVLDCSLERDQPVRLANPRLTEASAETAKDQEGSPNLPGVTATVERPIRVTVAYLDETGTEQARSFEGLWARSVQHQIDHLDGKIYADRLSTVKRKMLLARAAKTRRAGK